MLGALGAALGAFSPLLGQVVLGYAVSPSPAAPFCWVFCLSPREPVGPEGLCAQALSKSCRCHPSQAARPLISGYAALGLSHAVLGSAVLVLWVGQLASAPDAHPPEVSGVGALPGFWCGPPVR